MTLSSLIIEIETYIENMYSCGQTHYFNYEGLTIRVSGHNANPSRMRDNMISIVVDVKEYDEEGDLIVYPKEGYKFCQNQYNWHEVDLTELIEEEIYQMNQAIAA